MKSFRLILSVTVVIALGAGYLGSQYFALNGRAVEWAALVDTPLVAWVALAVLVGSIVLSFVRSHEENG